VTATTPADARLVVDMYRATPYARGRRALVWMWDRPIARALTRALITVFLVTTMNFVLIRLMPGNAIDNYIAQIMNEQLLSYEDAAQQASGLFNLDLKKPIHEQYLTFLGDLVRGNLGTSMLSQGTSVASIIAAYLPWTLFTVGLGLLLSFTVGTFLGLIAAYRRNSLFDHVVSTIGSILSAIPNYITALILVVIFGTQLRLLPIAQMRGSSSPGVAPGFNLEYLVDILFHAALPVAVYFLATVGHWLLSMKSATIATLEEDYVTAARARGLSDGRISTAYVGRNAVLPLVSQLAITAGLVVGGAFFIEVILVYPGIGLRLFKSIEQRDYTVMQGIVLLLTISVILANIFADVIYAKLDPRIGRAGGANG
jgi:peptide/nickel transport system permease protein